MDRTLTRGDDYLAPNRPVYVYRLVDPTVTNPDTGEPMPFNFAGSTIRATFKPAPTDPNEDPTDTDAPIKADITFDADGAVVSASNWALPPDRTAADGELMLILDKAATRALPLPTALKSDLEVTDASGHVETVILIGDLTTAEGYTNRSGGTP